MFSNQQVFSDVFVPIKSTNGVYRYITPTSDSLNDGRKTIEFQSCQPLTAKRYAKDYMLTGKIKLEITPTANGVVDIIGDLNKVMRCTVGLNGNQTIISEPETAYLFENVTGLCTDPSFGTEYHTRDSRTLTSGTTKTITFDFCTKFVNPALRGTIGGINNMRILIEFPDDLRSLLFLSGTASGVIITMSDVQISYTEYDGGSDIFAKRIPIYTVHRTDIEAINVGATADKSTTRITNTGAPVLLSTFAARKTNQSWATTATQNATKTLEIVNWNANINGKSNVLNVIDGPQVYARSVSAGYKGTLSDFKNSKNLFRYAAAPAEYLNTSSLTSVGCANCKDIGIDIGTMRDNFDYVGSVKVHNGTGANIAANTYSLITVLVQNAVLSLNPQNSQIIMTGEMDGLEIGDYQAVFDISEIEGAGFFDFMKNAFRKVVKYGPGAIKTASQIAQTVAPNSQFTRTMGKVDNVSDIISNNYGRATTVF